MSTQPSTDRDLQLEAYKVLVSMLQHDDILFWRRFEIFLVVNSALFTLLGLTKPATAIPSIVSTKDINLVIGGIGLILCLAWIAIIIRSEAFYNHWFEQLEYLEKQYLAPMVVFTTADNFFANGEIVMGDRKFTLGFFAKRLRMFRTVIAVPIFFFLGWIILGIYTILG